MVPALSALAHRPPVQDAAGDDFFAHGWSRLTVYRDPSVPATAGRNAASATFPPRPRAAMTIVIGLTHVADAASGNERRRPLARLATHRNDPKRPRSGHYGASASPDRGAQYGRHAAAVDQLAIEAPAPTPASAAGATAAPTPTRCRGRRRTSRCRTRSTRSSCSSASTATARTRKSGRRAAPPATASSTQ